MIVKIFISAFVFIVFYSGLNAQANKLFNNKTDFLYISIKENTKKKKIIRQNNNAYQFIDSCLTNFQIISNKHIYSYNQCKSVKTILSLNEVGLKIFEFNSDSFVNIEKLKYNIDIRPETLEFIRCNDSFCLLKYSTFHKQTLLDTYLVYSYNLIAQKIDSVVFTISAISIKFGNDPYSMKKLGIIIRDESNDEPNLIIFDLSSLEIVSEIPNISNFVFVPNSDTLITVSGDNRELSIFNIKGEQIYRKNNFGRYKISDRLLLQHNLNWTSKNIVIFGIYRNKILERKKTKYLIFQYKDGKIKKICSKIVEELIF